MALKCTECVEGYLELHNDGDIMCGFCGLIWSKTNSNKGDAS